MKTFGTILVVATIFSVVWASFAGINSMARYSNEIGSNWELAIKASTIEQKKEYVDKFVASFSDKDYAGEHDALFWPTPNNSFDENYKALLSLQKRLTEIQDMDPNSFEYQTALQQITGQEMDEATEMIGVLRGIWFKENEFFVWVGGVLWTWIVGFVLFFVAIALLSL